MKSSKTAPVPTETAHPLAVDLDLEFPVWDDVPERAYPFSVSRAFDLCEAYAQLWPRAAREAARIGSANRCDVEFVL